MAALQQIHEKIKKDLGNMGIEILEFIVCISLEFELKEKKAKSGMILEACKKYKLH